MPLNNKVHEKRLQERAMYSESQISWTLDRAEMYAEHNRSHPGFFDMMINSGEYINLFRQNPDDIGTFDSISKS